MSWYDRDYYREPSSGFGGSGMSFGFPPPSKYVKYLLIINIAVFILQAIFRGRIEAAFALLSFRSLDVSVVWRIVTYQFLHGGTFHLLFNMLGLYFFGPPIERLWGSKKFLAFYLGCGVIGGLAYLALSAITGTAAFLIGASGAVLGLLAACAVLFPQMMIILLIFPVPIRFAALLLAGIYALNVISAGNLADACHFGGMLAGFIYTYYQPMLEDISRKRYWERQERLSKQEIEDQRKIDEILEKVHRDGINSLSWREKRTLKKITQRQRERDMRKR